MHYHKFITCNLCKKPILDSGTLNPAFGTCHIKCLTQKLLWRERVLELEALK